MKSLLQRKKGFTLVELLIVISIIGVLTSVVIGSTNASRIAARDTKRISDMKEIELGLALYFDVNKVYPAGSDTGALSILVTQKYLPEIPTDPTGTAYEYMTSNGDKSYCIGVRLEGPIPNDTVNCTSKSPVSNANYKSQR